MHASYGEDRGFACELADTYTSFRETLALDKISWVDVMASLCSTIDRQETASKFP